MSKFVIVGTQRSGTTMLMNSLDGLKKISCFGEILSEKASQKPIVHWQEEIVKQRKMKAENCYGKWLEEQNPDGSLSDFLDDLFRRNEFVGFKMLYRHYIKKRDLLDDYFSRNPDIKFIHIYRENKIKQAISHKLKKSVRFTEKMYVDKDWVINKMVPELNRMEDELYEFLKDKRYISLCYEDLTGDREIRKLPKVYSNQILHFLKYPERIQQVPINIKKHWPSEIKDRVKNYRDFI